MDSKKKIFLTTIFILLKIASSYSQSNFYIKSFNENSFLAFATISNISTKTTYSANELGVAKISSKANDTLIVSYVGYTNKQIVINKENITDTIFLKRSTKTLKEVFINNCKNGNELVISNIDSGNTIGRFGGIHCTKGNFNGKVAVKIQHEKDGGLLHSFSFWLTKFPFFHYPDHAVKSPLLFSFYSVADSSNLPEELLYENPLFYFPKKEGKQKLKIDSLGIRIPKEGIFICFEFVMDERYQWEIKSNDSIRIQQGVAIDGEYAYGFNLAFFDHTNDRWIKAKYPNSTLHNKMHGTIKIEAVVKYCK